MVNVRCFGISTKLVCTIPEDSTDTTLSGKSFSEQKLYLEDMVCEEYHDLKEKQIMVRCLPPKWRNKSNRDDWVCVGNNGLVTCDAEKTGNRVLGLGMKLETKEGFIQKYL